MNHFSSLPVGNQVEGIVRRGISLYGKWKMVHHPLAAKSHTIGIEGMKVIGTQRYCELGMLYWYNYTSADN